MGHLGSRNERLSWDGDDRNPVVPSPPRRVADQANALGRYDADIHNAGIGHREPRRIETVAGLSHVFVALSDVRWARMPMPFLVDPKTAQSSPAQQGRDDIGVG